MPERRFYRSYLPLLRERQLFVCGFNRWTQQIGEIVQRVFRSLAFSLGGYLVASLLHLAEPPDATGGFDGQRERHPIAELDRLRAPFHFTKPGQKTEQRTLARGYISQIARWDSRLSRLATIGHRETDDTAQSSFSETVFVPVAFSRTTIAMGIPCSNDGTTLTARYPGLPATALATESRRLFLAFAIALF